MAQWCDFCGVHLDENNVGVVGVKGYQMDKSQIKKIRLHSFKPCDMKPQNIAF